MSPFQFPTPYINPPLLLSAATGISWSTIPNRQATPEQQLAEQYNLCQRASGFVDTAADQVLRATITTEQLKGPGSPRFEIDGIGNATVLLSRSPILQVLGGQVAPAMPPLQWTTIPANMWVINSPPLRLYGTSVPGDAGEWGQIVTLGGGYVSTWGGRGNCFLQVEYVNGWPHTSLTAIGNPGDTVLQVDDCTGWAPPAGLTQGAAGVVYDPSVNSAQETAVVTAASVASGPGTLTITPALTWEHQQGIVFSAMPSQVFWSAIIFSVGQALTRGATATTVQTIGPSAARTTDDPYTLMKYAEEMAHFLKRVR